MEKNKTVGFFIDQMYAEFDNIMKNNNPENLTKWLGEKMPSIINAAYLEGRKIGFDEGVKTERKKNERLTKLN